MTVTKKKTLSQCECCDKKNTTIQRRYKGEGYCPNCYRTWFINKPCKKCGETHKAHKKEKSSICRKCKMKEPCIRCGGDAFKDGTNSEYGRVCATCHRGYFKKKKKCYECGEMKRNISSYFLLKSIDYPHQICTTCYGKMFHGTCKLCNRHRWVIKRDDGSKVCKKCSQGGLITCNTCHKLMPAGVGKRCWDCYWQERLQKEVHINSHLFDSQSIRKDYKEFTQYFSQNRGAMVAKLKNNNFIEFFVRCDEIWGKIPSYRLLVEEFKPDGLRHNLTVLRWLIAKNRVIEDLAIKDRVAEEERILRLLEKLETLPEVVKDYHQYLLKKQQKRKTSIKTVRMNLQPAVGIYEMFNFQGANTPNQEQIDTYLLAKSGQYNSLYGFVTYLNNKKGLSLACKQPSKDEIDRANKKAAERQLLILSCKQKPLSEKDEYFWYQLSMAYFHKKTISMKNLKASEIKEANEEMLSIIFDNQDYWIPKSNPIN